MSRYKSEQTAYSQLKKKYVPLWQLDTNTMTVTHLNADTQTEHRLSITAEDSFLIATVSLLPKLYLTGDSITDFLFYIVKILNDPAFIDEPAKPVGAMAVREMKVIPDEVSMVGLALLGLRIGIEVCDGQCVGVQSPQRN